MAYIPSTHPDWTESIPWILSARTEGATYKDQGAAFDVALAGIPFQFALSDQRPYQRKTATWKKQQIDTSAEPGEQTLNEAYWLRSQNSWHHGSGVNFYEPTSDPGSEHRAKSTVGLDIWTQGQASLLHAMGKVATPTTGAYVATAVVTNNDVYFTNVDGAVARRTASGSTPYTGSTTAVGVPVVAGGSLVVQTATGLFKGSTSGNTISAWLTGSTGVTPFWVKQRIIGANGPSLYEIGLGAAGALPAALYTHPDTSWKWTSITETTDAILAAGYSNGVTSIYRFSLVDNGAGQTPTLSSAFSISDFPPGEQINAIKAYLGKYIAIGTNLGLRVGIITGATSISPTVIQYGPLLYINGGGVTCLAARDRFIYAGVNGDIDGMSGVVRVSLDEEVVANSLRWPYAFDAQTHTATPPNSIGFLGNTARVVLGSADGLWLQSDTLYEPTGYFLSGKVRYATSEPKAFRLARIRGQLPAGTELALSTVAGNGAESFITGLASLDSDDDVTIARPIGTFEYLSFRIALNASPDQLSTPTLESYTIKAVPAPKRQRELSIWLACFNRVEDRNGSKMGQADSSFAWDRLSSLETLESAQAVVPYQDFTTGESIQVSIEEVAFMRTTNPHRGSNNFGGFINLTIREL